MISLARNIFVCLVFLALQVSASVLLWEFLWVLVQECSNSFTNILLRAWCFWRFCRSSHTSSDLYINSHEYSGVKVCLLHQETFIALWKKKAWLSALLYFLVLIENRSFDLSLIFNNNNKNTYRALCPPIAQSAVQQWLNYKIQKLVAVIMKLTELA